MTQLEQFAKGYRMLASFGYRPAAPGDGFGGITVPVEELDLDAEALRYARDFLRQDQAMVWEAGCTDYTLAPCAVLALEAFRLMNAGRIWGAHGDAKKTLVPRILRKAAAEYERIVREEIPE